MESKIKETVEWRDQAVKDQEAQPMYEMPKMTTSLIAEKALDMDREVKYLYNKVKIGKAKAEKDKEKADKEKEKKSKKKKKSKSKDAETEGSGEEAEQTEENPENTEGMQIFLFFGNDSCMNTVLVTTNFCDLFRWRNYWKVLNFM